MPISITQALNIQEARLGFPELDSFIRWHQVTLAPETAAALVVPNDALPRHLGVDTEMLLLLLPSELARHAEALAIGELVSDNELSEDLLTSDTLLSVETTHVAVDTNVRDISNSFPTEENEGWFYVGVAAGDRFVLGQHCLGRLWVEAFLAGLQGDCSSSGINYNPRRYWSEAELEAARRKPRAPDSASAGSLRRHRAVGVTSQP